jgi:CHASE2 domain-containing sensor protein/class 3 adenylate cyclase
VFSLFALAAFGYKKAKANHRMSSEMQTLRMAVLLFTDIVDSVGLEHRLGTEAYSRLLKLHHQLFRQALTETGAGKIHLDTGDGFLSEFTTPAQAVNTALLFQMLLREADWNGEVPKVRIGIHQGQLAEIRFDSGSPGRIVGLPVSIASRVMNLAQPGQILLTRPVYDDARQFIRDHPTPREMSVAAPRLRWVAHGSYVFQGTEGSQEIFEVGAAGLAPLTAPRESEKARRASVPGPSRMRVRRPALTAALITALCGLAIWAVPFGDKWANASYDSLYRFGNRAPTNKLALILMDDTACQTLGQTRQSWDRALHAELLNRLADARCPLVVFDILFKSPRAPETDAKLAEAMRRHGHVVLMSKVTDPRVRTIEAGQVIRPAKLFLDAATNYGIGQASPGLIVRQHWPFPASADDQFLSLPLVAARLAGARLSDQSQQQWLRYYGELGPWESFPYNFALTNTSYFRDKIVWVGGAPENRDPSRPEDDKFCTPYTRWGERQQAVGGVEILATTFLNLMNGDWLRRPPWGIEALLFIGFGAALGGGLSRFSRLTAVILAAVAALVITLASVSLSYFTNYWYPWLIVVGAQVPCAVVCTVLLPATAEAVTKLRRSAGGTLIVPAPAPTAPEVPNYELFGPPVGMGGFGEVWVARSLIGQWQAVKVVYKAKFGDNPGPYEAEFNGIKKYKPVSEKHPGLLRIELIGEGQDRAYFYYVMELGDALNSGWEQKPATYKPRDLESVRKQNADRRLPVPDCLRIGTTLAEALEFLHSQGLTHRDIKPSNVIFVHGQPKLADVGLVTDIRAPKSIKTWVGTAGYMPPPPERPGTAQADIFALGMVLYVISTGRDPELFPELATTLIENSGHADFMRLNAIILKACQPDLRQRYQTTADMARALREAQHHLRGPIQLPKA